MTFDDLKNAVPFETVFIDRERNKRLFIGLDPRDVEYKLITKSISTNVCHAWKEKEITDWTIKKVRKLYAYQDQSDGEVVFYADDKEEKRVIHGYTQLRAPDYDLTFEGK